MYSKGSNRPIWHGFVLAVALVALAGAARLWPLHSLGTSVVYTTFYPAVVIAALYGGISAGLTAMLFSCLAVLFAGPSMYGESVTKDFADWLGVAVFVVNCALISGIAEAMRRSRSRVIQAQLELERSNAELKAARDNLEDEVTLRTAELAHTNTSLEKELTERKKAEEALRESEQRLRLFIEHAPTAIAMFDREMRYLAVSQRWLMDYGLGDGDIIRRSHYEIFPEMPNRWKAVHQRGLAGEVVRADEDSVERVDGAAQWLRWEVRPWYSADGVIGGIVIFTEDITERKQAEKELKASEARLKESQAIAHLGSWELDIANNILTWSDEVYRIFGLQPQEFKATYEKFLQHVHPDDREAVDEAYSGSLRDGKDTYEIEHRVVRKSTGEVRTVQEKCEHIRDESRQIVRSVGMVHDITDRKMAEQALLGLKNNLEIRVQERTAELEEANRSLQDEMTERKRAEDELVSAVKEIEDLYNNAPCGYHSLDSDGVFIRINDTEISWLGYTREEIIGKKRLQDVITSESLKTFLENFPRFMERGSISDVEYDMVRKDGTILPVLLNATAVKDSSGNFVMSRGTIFDISRRRLAEERLRESEIRYRQMFENNRAVKLLIDPKSSEIIDANQAASEFYGYGLDRLKQMKMTDINLLPPEEIFQRMSEAYTEQEDYFQFQHRLASGETRYVEVYSSPIELNGKSVLYSIVHDISDRHKAQEELIRSNQDLQQFAYVASHDLQEPLRNVASCLQLLEKKYKGELDGDADQLMHYATDSAVRMKALILDLLTYSRIATKGKPAQPVNCEKLLDQTMENLRSSIIESEAVITHDLLPTVSGDDTQLLQVFQNLIGNAIKFRRDDPAQIHVSAVKNKNEWVFSIKDNGIGIEPRHLDRIFVIFQRLNKRSQYDGTGMGLAIVKKVVERHGGRIWAESEPGAETTFYFTIPYKGNLT
jgi:PAS domain S-box-containing protein